jgi:pilus assembly protein CpaB
MFVDVLKKARGAGGGETVQVVRAVADIAPTSEITEAMIETVPVPRQLVPRLSFTDPKEVIGRVSVQMIPQEMPIVPSALAPKGTPPGMAAKIRDGYRAVAVKVDEVVGVAGWVKPGNRVDVVAVMPMKKGNKSEVISRVILQNIEVLAVGQDIGNSGETGAAIAKSVTLLVKPDSVTKLHLASTQGTVRLAMRGTSDDNASEVASASDNELLGPEDENNNGGTTKGSSLKDKLFGKVPKIDAKETDKPDSVANLLNTVSLAPANKPWVVEVMSGASVYKIVFDGERKDSRRLGGDSDRSRQIAPPPPPSTDTRAGAGTGEAP